MARPNLEKKIEKLVKKHLENATLVEQRLIMTLLGNVHEERNKQDSSFHIPASKLQDLIRSEVDLKGR